MSNFVQPLNPINLHLIKQPFLSKVRLMYNSDALNHELHSSPIFLFILLILLNQNLTAQPKPTLSAPGSNEIIHKSSMGIGTGLALSDILPKQINGMTYNMVNTTPIEISQKTNLKDILSFDYTIGDSIVAAAVATKTMGTVYDHPKIVTERLKGFELTNIQSMIVSSVSLIRYELKNKKGRIVYGTNFSIGAKNGRSNYTIQSTWLNKDYFSDEMLFNIQLWSESLTTVVNMSKDIIANLKNGYPVTAIPVGISNPKAFITTGKTKANNIILTVNNSSLATSGYIELIQKKTEQTTVLTKKQIPITIPLNSKASFNVSVADNFESTINLYMNTTMQDQVIFTDGSWGATIDSTKGILKTFKINSTPNFVNSDTTEYKLFRNVQVDANIPDFVTVYKILVDDGSPLDLTAYKTLQFTASGTGATLAVTLIKKSILNWTDQFSAIVPITATATDFKLSLDDFVSTATTDKIVPDDISMIVFGLVVSNPAISTVSSTISNVSFTVKTLAYLNSLRSAEVSIYPNPVTGRRFTVGFKAAAINNLNLQLIELNTGRVVFNKSLLSQIGSNTVSVNLTEQPTTNTYILSLEGPAIKYNSKKIIMNK